MKKLSILVVSALSMSLLLAGNAFADQDTLRNQDNFRSSAAVSLASSDMVGEQGVAGIYFTAEDQVGSLNPNQDLSGNSAKISKLNEHYGQAPSWSNSERASAEEEIIDGQ